MSLTKGLFCMCVYVNGITNSVLYTEVSLIQGCPLRGVPLYSIIVPLILLLHGITCVLLFSLYHILSEGVCCFNGISSSNYLVYFTCTSNQDELVMASKKLEHMKLPAIT